MADEPNVDWVAIKLNRRKNDCGVEMSVEASPRVEEFMSMLGGGETDPLEAYGRMWISPDAEHPLLVYRLFENPEQRNARYDITSPAGAFRDSMSGRTNLSFLRIAGISRPGGIKFKIGVPVSNGELDDLAKTLTFGSRQFITDYLTPAKVSLKVVSGD